MLLPDRKRMQPPSNKKLFTDRFVSGAKNNIFVSVLVEMASGRSFNVTDFEFVIKDIMRNYGFLPNKSLGTHIATGLGFHGFVRNYNGVLIIPPHISDFVEELVSITCDEYKCVDTYLYTLADVHYPNWATKQAADPARRARPVPRPGLSGRGGQ